MTLKPTKDAIEAELDAWEDEADAIPKLRRQKSALIQRRKAETPETEEWRSLDRQIKAIRKEIADAEALFRKARDQKLMDSFDQAELGRILKALQDGAGDAKTRKKELDALAKDLDRGVQFLALLTGLAGFFA